MTLLNLSPAHRTIPMWTSFVGSALLQQTLELGSVCVIACCCDLRFLINIAQSSNFTDVMFKILRSLCDTWRVSRNVHFCLQVILDVVRTASLRLFRVRFSLSLSLSHSLLFPFSLLDYCRVFVRLPLFLLVPFTLLSSISLFLRLFLASSSPSCFILGGPFSCPFALKPFHSPHHSDTTTSSKSALL